MSLNIFKIKTYSFEFSCRSIFLMVIFNFDAAAFSLEMYTLGTFQLVEHFTICVIPKPYLNFSFDVLKDDCILLMC